MADSITEPARTAADGPHTRPTFAGEQRSRTLTWRIGAAGDATPLRARLCIDHYNCAGYFATLRAPHPHAGSRPPQRPARPPGHPNLGTAHH